MRRFNTRIQTRSTLPVLLLTFLAAGRLSSHAQDGISSVPSTLSVYEIVHNLEERNQLRSQALHRFEGTRVYSLHYRGFPHNYDAEMVVGVTYQSPGTKVFTVLSQSGSKFVVEHVFKKALESEKEAGQEQARTALNRQNYDFAMAGYETGPEGARYVLAVTPKSKNKFLYRGKVWIDAADFAVVKIEAEPAQNPSFWIKKTQIRHTYKSVDGFWLPAENHSQSFVRLGGQAELSIVYKDYKITAADPLPSPQSMAQRVPNPAVNR